MTFDFFNTSNLAFGGKLTTAFKQLFNQVEQAKDNIDSVLERQAIYAEYLFKNYIVGQPTNGSNPCRTNEILNLVKGINYIGDIDITFSGDNNNTSDTLVVNANVYDKSLNIVSKISASKTLTTEDWCFSTTLNGRKNGNINTSLRYYLFFKPATDNMSMIVDCRLSDKNDIQEDEELLFKIKLRLVSNKIYKTISSHNSKYSFLIGGFNNYNQIKNEVLNTQSEFGETVYQYEKLFTDIKLHTIVTSKRTVAGIIIETKKNFIESATASRDFILALTVTGKTKLKINEVTRYSLDYSSYDETTSFIIVKEGDVLKFENINRVTQWDGVLLDVKGVDPSNLKITTYTEK